MTEAKPEGRFSGLKVRILSGLILAPLMITIVIAGDLWFIGLMMAAALVSLYEWVGLAKAGPHQIPMLILGMIYLIISYGSYICLRFGFESGAWLALTVVLAVWASDIGAYFAGKFIGGPKMAPKLSPKKTWAGLAGSMISCGAMLVLLLNTGTEIERYIRSMSTYTGFSPEDWVPVFIAGLLLGVVGQAGDLLISLFKRRAHLKDTGHLIPGHGGLLDRIDALMLVSPVFLLLCVAFLK